MRSNDRFGVITFRNLRETNNHAGARTIDPAQHTERDKSRPSLTPFANINNMVAIVININI